MLAVALFVLVWVAIGVLLIVFRKTWARLNGDALRAGFGRLGRTIADQASPTTYAIMGVFAIAVGILILVLFIARQLS